MDFLLATSNPGKTQELRELLEGFPVTLRTLADFPDIPDVAETATTFEENAVAKAMYYAEQTGLPTLADDGGLEIDALNGWPGVRSRRIFGDGRRATDGEMITEVLRRMEGIPSERRGCQMRSVVAFTTPEKGPGPFSGEGIDRGIIAERPSAYRIPGFPFRSIFYHPEQGMTTAEAVERGARMADVMTHRRNAVAQLLPKLQQWLSALDRGRM